MCKHSQHSSYTSVPSHKKNHPYERKDMEGYSCPFSRLRRLHNSTLQDGYKKAASLRPRWTTIWRLNALGHNPGQYCWKRLQNKGHTFPQKRIEYCEDSTNFLAYFRAIQGHSGGRPIDPELMGCVRMPQGIFVTEVVLSAFNLSWRMDWFRVDMEATKGRQTVFFTPLNPFGSDSDDEEPVMITHFLKKRHYHSHWKRNKDAVCLVKLSRAQDQEMQFWQTKSYAIIVHSPVPAVLS